MVLLFPLGCKSSKTITQSPQKADSTLLAKPAAIDSIEYWITSEGDTLNSLGNEVNLELTKVHKDTITIAAVGDIMMGTNFPQSSYLPKNAHSLWEFVQPVLTGPDMTFGNLEGVILTDGGDQKECRNPKNCFLFRTPDSLSHLFVENGFDLLSLANNHASDFGLSGRLNTQRVLDSLGIHHAGSIEQPYSIIKAKGYTLGFIAFAPNRGTQNIHNEELALEYVRKLDSLADIVIVSFHAGAEGSRNQHVTREREFYFGEDRGNVYEFSHLMIDSGADLILGHGPHVVRAMEVYKERLIAYSLGNFLTYGRFNLKGPNAYAPVLEVKINSYGEFLKGKIHSFIQDYSLGPIYDPKRRSLFKIKELTDSDFPKGDLIIQDDGLILKK